MTPKLCQWTGVLRGRATFSYERTLWSGRAVLGPYARCSDLDKIVNPGKICKRSFRRARLRVDLVLCGCVVAKHHGAYRAAPSNSHFPLLRGR